LVTVTIFGIIAIRHPMALADGGVDGDGIAITPAFL